MCSTKIKNAQIVRLARVYIAKCSKLTPNELYIVLLNLAVLSKKKHWPYAIGIIEYEPYELF